jgi:hypothetical protein
MTVNELIEILEQYDGEREVRLATQPTYPLAHTVGGVAGEEEVDEEDDDGRRVVRDDMEADGPVFVLEGSQLGYANKSLWGSN